MQRKERLTHPRSILITGASSGIGAELAKQYATAGVTLYLTGRNSESLHQLQQSCQTQGATVHIKAMDITDRTAVIHWISSLPALDLVIANAGISAGTGGGGESLEQVSRIFNTNIYGVLHTIHPAIDCMKKQGHGQIVIISSMAGYRGLPGSPAYSASKAAVKVYGEALRGVLAKEGIAVTVITPGYIRTPMTAVNRFPMPFLMNVDKAATYIIRKLRSNPARIAFPWPVYAAVWLFSALPPFIIDPIVSRLPAKSSEVEQQK